MKLIQQWFGMGLLCLVGQQVSASIMQDLDAALSAELNAVLMTEQQPYVLKADPQLEKKLLAQKNNNNYQVGWIVPPKIEFKEGDYKDYKNPIRLKMTVLADDGRIIKTEVLKSSGSKMLDYKVIQALASAKLEGIPMMDRNVIYSFVHEFSINNS